MRTKRKAQTQRKIASAARDLFFLKGYDATTLEEIAEAAGVHVQTLYRHFSSKQELASSGDQRWFDEFTDLIADPERTTNTFEFWREWLRMSFAYLTQDGGSRYRKYIAVRHANPQILGQLSNIRSQYEDLLCLSLAKEFGLPADGIGKPRLVAGMLLAGSNYTLRRFETEDIDLVAEALRVVDEVESIFGHLIKT